MGIGVGVGVAGAAWRWGAPMGRTVGWTGGGVGWPMTGGGTTTDGCAVGWLLRGRRLVARRLRRSRQARRGSWRGRAGAAQDRLGRRLDRRANQVRSLDEPPAADTDHRQRRNASGNNRSTADRPRPHADGDGQDRWHAREGGVDRGQHVQGRDSLLARHTDGGVHRQVARRVVVTVRLQPLGEAPVRVPRPRLLVACHLRRRSAAGRQRARPRGRRGRRARRRVWPRSAGHASSWLVAVRYSRRAPESARCAPTRSVPRMVATSVNAKRSTRPATSAARRTCVSPSSAAMAGSAAPISTRAAWRSTGVTCRLARVRRSSFSARRRSQAAARSGWRSSTARCAPAASAVEAACAARVRSPCGDQQRETIEARTVEVPERRAQQVSLGQVVGHGRRGRGRLLGAVWDDEEVLWVA